jgi:phage terminase small subunit
MTVFFQNTEQAVLAGKARQFNPELAKALRKALVRVMYDYKRQHPEDFNAAVELATQVQLYREAIEAYQERGEVIQCNRQLKHYTTL